jgi:DNA-binding transcriptional regulator YhcF (GntR family)
MSWNFSNDKAIYLQIMDIIIQKIVIGEYKSGTKLPTVRELAAQIQVNPNTVQRAFTDLEELKIICTKSTSGRFVSEDEKLIKEYRDKLANQNIDDFFEKMTLIGFKHDEIIKYLIMRKGEE